MITPVKYNLPEIDLGSYDQKWTWGDDLKVLAALGKKLQGNIVEIGCNEGRTTKFLSETFPEKTIVGIDWTGSPTMAEGEMPCAVTKEQIGRLVRAHPNVVIHDQVSWGFDYGVYRPLSLIFIDGDHQFDSVMKDTMTAFSVLQNQEQPCYVAWHDAVKNPQEEWNGVWKCLEKLNLDIRIQVQTMTAFTLYWK